MIFMENNGISELQKAFDRDFDEAARIKELQNRMGDYNYEIQFGKHEFFDSQKIEDIKNEFLQVTKI